MMEPVRARINIYQAALRAIADSEGTQIVMAGIDIARLNRRYTAPPHPHQEALDQLAQSVNALATKRGTDFLARLWNIVDHQVKKKTIWP